MFDIGKTFKISIPGRGSLTLGPVDHVTSGGEGHVYRRGPMGVKIWDDPDHAVRGRMAEKISLLQALRHPHITVPEATALDDSGRMVGCVMPWVENGVALPPLFTTGWRNANGFSDADALRFAARMRETVAFVHSKNATIGDGNELNILAADGEPRYIDVDPWALPGFPGDKIMPMIRDWHAPPFSKEADWFAWGVVVFQLLVGIHPFRGNHPAFKKNDVEGRMKANASVFAPGVRLSPAVRPFSTIPRPLLDWFRATFDQGERSMPPDPQAPAPKAKDRATARPTGIGTGLVVSGQYKLPGQIQRTCGPDMLMLTNGALIDLPTGRTMGSTDPRAALSRGGDGTVAGILHDRGRVLFGKMPAGPGRTIRFETSEIGGLSVWSSENRLFVVTADGLLEVQVRSLGSGQTLLPGRKWSVKASTTTFGDGIAVLKALGASYAVVPFGTGAVGVVRMRELDGLTPVSMTRTGQVAVLSLIDQAGTYHRAKIAFDVDYEGYLFSGEPAEDGAVDAVITPSRIIAHFDEGGNLDLEMPASGARRSAPAGTLAAGRLLSGPSGMFVASGLMVSKISLA